MSNLTSKQEKFCNNIVKGMTQIDAYKDSYDAENMLDESISTKACLKMKEVKIRSRIEELRRPIVEDTQRTLKTILEEINSIKVSSLKEDKKLALDCLKHEAKLRGFEVDKSDITSNGQTVSMPTITRNGKPIKVKMGDKK